MKCDFLNTQHEILIIFCVSAGDAASLCPQIQRHNVHCAQVHLCVFSIAVINQNTFYMNRFRYSHSAASNDLKKIYRSCNKMSFEFFSVIITKHKYIITRTHCRGKKGKETAISTNRVTTENNQDKTTVFDFL